MTQFGPSRLVKAMEYKLIHSHNPDTLGTLVNEALKNGAVFCGGPVTRQSGEIIQAVVWPEIRDTEYLPEPNLNPPKTADEAPPAPVLLLEGKLCSLGSDREGLSFDTLEHSEHHD